MTAHRAPVSVGCIVNRYATVDAAERRRLVGLAEAAGLDHFAVGDHVSFRTGVGSDGLLAASTILATSAKLAANTAVYLLPLRHPVPVARQLADLAVLAPGRFLFGVGIGGEDPHEVESCGVDPKTRGRRMDESLQVIRALLAGGPVDFAGEHVAVEQVEIAPTPTVPVPIVVGGRSEAAIRRAGRFGDGWFGIWVSPERYGAAIAAMEEAAAEAGRAATERVNALNVWCGVGEDRDEAVGYVGPAMQAYYGIPYDRFERWSPAGTVDEIASFLSPYAEAGCSLFNVIVNGPNPEREVEAVGEIRQLLQAAVA